MYFNDAFHSKLTVKLTVTLREISNSAEKWQSNLLDESNKNAEMIQRLKLKKLNIKKISEINI